MKFCSLCKQPMTADNLHDVWKPNGEKITDVCYVCIEWINEAFDMEIKEIQDLGDKIPADPDWLQHVHESETKPELN